jgi:hypothetical protein
MKRPWSARQLPQTVVDADQASRDGRDTDRADGVSAYRTFIDAAV